jgi:hypothetical protein
MALLNSVSRPPLALSAAVALTLALGGCLDDSTGPDDRDFLLDPVATGLSSPVFLTAPPGDERRFVVEQTGAIQILDIDGTVESTPFLDLSDRITTAGNEQGLLGLAFHPDYGTNGRFFVSYTASDGDSRIEEYGADPGADQAGSEPVQLILEVEQPQSNHNGGHLAFGPDGMLYIGLGDGGGAFDPDGNAQDSTTLLGSILRIDVDGGSPYAIPPDNPFVGDAGARDEIWHYGLRNPWRFSFDTDLDFLFIGDVGQDTWEEINIARIGSGGRNFGWAVMEGQACVEDGCDAQAYTLPALQYDHGFGCSVVGGYVYRGPSAPGLAGLYLFSDFCEGWVRVVAIQGGTISFTQEVNLEPVGQVTSFGEDASGEVYVLTRDGGVYRIVPL